MIKIYQTDFTNDTGNCLSACVASLLDRSLEAVPNFKAINQKNPISVMIEWVRGYSYNVVSVQRLWDCTKGTLCIACVRSERYEGGKYYAHAVIARIGRDGRPRLLHDPNPDSKRKVGKVLDEWNALYFIYQGFNIDNGK